MWRFGKRTVEKPLDSEERENSTKTRQTDRRWLRLTGFATTLPFLPYWSSRSIIPFFLSFFPPSLPPSIRPSSSSPSVTGELFSGHLLPRPVVLRQQLCYSLRTTCRRDPEHTPRSQTGAPHTKYTHADTQQRQRQQQRDHT